MGAGGKKSGGQRAAREGLLAEISKSGLGAGWFRRPGALTSESMAECLNGSVVNNRAGRAVGIGGPARICRRSSLVGRRPRVGGILRPGFRLPGFPCLDAAIARRRSCGRHGVSISGLRPPGHVLHQNAVDRGQGCRRHPPRRMPPRNLRCGELLHGIPRTHTTREDMNGRHFGARPWPAASYPVRHTKECSL